MREPRKPYCKAKMIGESVYSYYYFCAQCDARLGGLGCLNMRFCPFCATPLAEWSWADGYEKIQSNTLRLPFGAPDPDFYDACHSPRERPDTIDGTARDYLQPQLTA